MNHPADCDCPACNWNRRHADELNPVEDLDLYRVIHTVLEEHDGCCLDNKEEVAKVASALTERLKDRWS